MPETSCMKGTSLHIKNMWIKQLSNHKVPDFAMALRAWKVSGAFGKQAPEENKFVTVQDKAKNEKPKIVVFLQCSNMDWWQDVHF